MRTQDMTQGQKDVFLKAASFGIALGLEHRYEWLVNAERMLMHGPYTEIKESSDSIWDAFLAFEKTLACSPEEDKELSALTGKDLAKRVNDFYRKGASDGQASNSGTSVQDQG